MTPTRQEVIRVARECGAFLELSTTPEKDMAFLLRFAERFYEAGAAAAREPLTDGQILKAIRPFFRDDYNATLALAHSMDEYRAIEQAHGIAKATGEKT